MVLNYIWVGFFVVGALVAVFRVAGYYLQHNFDLFQAIAFDAADRDVFKAIVDSTFAYSETSVKLSIYLIGIMTLWLGIMRIGEKGGAIRVLSRMMAPLFVRLFPDIPKNHPAMGAMLMNLCANMLGLDNAATPMGLKAMKELQEVNKEKEKASNAQIMFLVLNTSGLTIIPVSIMAYRMGGGAANPSDVFLPILMATFCSTLAGLIIVSIYQRIRLFQPVVLAYIGGLAALIIGLFFFLQTRSKEEVEVFSNLIGNGIIFSFIIGFILLAWRKKINIYEEFIEGAKEGFGVAIKIIPYLVAMLVGIGVFRASGAFDWIVNGIGYLIGLTGVNTDFVPALPTAFMKPLSGSGARGMMIDTMEAYGPDSFVARLAGTFQGSTETTFYTLAVYFGAVGIRKTRYTLTCGLFADLIGIIAAIFIAYLFFHS